MILSPALDLTLRSQSQDLYFYYSIQRISDPLLRVATQLLKMHNNAAATGRNTTTDNLKMTEENYLSYFLG